VQKTITNNFTFYCKNTCFGVFFSGEGVKWGK